MTFCDSKKCHRMVPAAIFCENGAKICRTFHGRGDGENVSSLWHRPKSLLAELEISCVFFFKISYNSTLKFNVIGLIFLSYTLILWIHSESSSEKGVILFSQYVNFHLKQKTSSKREVCLDSEVGEVAKKDIAVSFEKLFELTVSQNLAVRQNYSTTALQKLFELTVSQNPCAVLQDYIL